MKRLIFGNLFYEVVSKDIDIFQPIDLGIQDYLIDDNLPFLEKK